jgi:hypothetical protein
MKIFSKKKESTQARLWKHKIRRKRNKKRQIKAQVLLGNEELSQEKDW